jgi:homocitrate synthase NifV
MHLPVAPRCNIKCGPQRFCKISRFVGKASRWPVPSWKAVVGEKVFSHESGLHTDGVIKNPLNYGGFDPAEVGLSRHLVLGKHSGTSGLLERFSRIGITISREDASSLMEQVRSAVQRVKRPLNDNELRRLHESVLYH